VGEIEGPPWKRHLGRRKAIGGSLRPLPQVKLSTNYGDRFSKVASQTRMRMPSGSSAISPAGVSPRPVSDADSKPYVTLVETKPAEGRGSSRPSVAACWR